MHGTVVTDSKESGYVHGGTNYYLGGNAYIEVDGHLRRPSGIYDNITFTTLLLSSGLAILFALCASR